MSITILIFECNESLGCSDSKTLICREKIAINPDEWSPNQLMILQKLLKNEDTLLQELLRQNYKVLDYKPAIDSTRVPKMPATSPSRIPRTTISPNTSPYQTSNIAEMWKQLQNRPKISW